MLSYTMDIEERSTWLRTTPSELELAQPFFCTEAGAFYARQRFTTERSHKDSHIVFYTLGGAGEVSQGGRSVTLEKGQALLMDCREPQCYFTSPGRHHWYHLWAHIDGSGVRVLGDILGLPTLRPVSMTLATVRPAFDTLLQNLAGSSRAEAVGTGLAVHQLLAAMVMASEDSMPAGEGDAVRMAQDFIERNFSEDLTVERIAGEVALSTSQLIRIFKRQTGTTPHNYLLRYRITRAKELLAETSMPVGQVSREVGFASESNFSYRFSQMAGQSPSAYRASAPRLFE